MKVLTIKEPFVSLIKENIKKIETRSWKTNYRGEIFIHCGLSKVNMKEERIKKLVSLLNDKSMNYGNIVLKAKLIDCVYMDDEFISLVKKDKNEYLSGRYEVGRYAWVLDNIELIDPIKVKGQLGIWNYYE